MLTENTPGLWAARLPKPRADDHKYTRGLALVYAAPELTGATRLAAEACARMGAGMVVVACPPAIAPVYRASLPPHIVVRDDPAWTDERVTAVLYGPGGVSHTPPLREIPAVIDADGLFHLPAPLHDGCVLTPHEGEFARLFPDIHGTRAERAAAAARRTGAVIVLKGAETLIAHPDGRLTVNRHASPYLATAGAGDVLAGMIAGLCAQGLAPYTAACAAVWMHGEAGLRGGPGLVASDLPGLIPSIMKDFA